MSCSGTSGPSHPPLRRRHLPISFLALSSLRRVGPYAVHTMVGETGGGRLFIGIDPILRRHVWIHEVPPGTPPVEATRRDVSRPGRLYWLAGRRSATENWDAFEAPRGEPFLTAPPTSDWRQVHRALSSLATELDASAQRSGTHGSVSPTCGGERTDNSCSSISRGPRRSRRTPIRLSVLSSCWRPSPRALCSRRGAGRAAVGHDAVASTCERIAASAR